MKRDDAAREEPHAHITEARRLDHLSKFRRTRKTADAGRQIRVRGATWKQLAQQRHDSVEPQSIEGRKQSARTGDLEDPDPATGRENAPKLRQRTLQIVDVPHAETDR